nr:MAG TPA: hypothetical protein [Caudoviricetes sp.]
MALSDFMRKMNQLTAFSNYDKIILTEQKTTWFHV